MPLEATMSSAPMSDCQPRPALTRRPATMEGTEAGSSTSVTIRRCEAPSMRAASMRRGSGGVRAWHARRRDEGRLEEFRTAKGVDHAGREGPGENDEHRPADPGA